MAHTVFPERLQARLDPITVDEKVKEAKAALLKHIKRSIYIYRVDCGGCNGCEIEIFGTITPIFDTERFGIKNMASPRHADILVYTGAVTRAMRLPALRAYEGAPDPKLVVSYGACGCTGGIFHDNYCVWGGTDKLIPVDIYIPGCHLHLHKLFTALQWHWVFWVSVFMKRICIRQKASKLHCCITICHTR